MIRARLEQLDAQLVLCGRREGDDGDPCYLRFGEAIAAGALPLSVQGNENGLTIEGGLTLGLELIAELANLVVRSSKLLLGGVAAGYVA